MKFKRKTILLILSAVLLVVTAVSLTLSILSTKTNALDNELAFGTGTIGIIENFDGWNIKEVWLKNTSEEIPGVVRAMLTPRVIDGGGSYVYAGISALEEPDANNQIVMGDFTFTFDDNWSDNWFYKDGFFYCRIVLRAGETSPLLLKKVSLTSDTPDIREKYADTQIKIDVIAHILQAEGGAPESEWGVTVTGSTVTS